MDPRPVTRFDVGASHGWCVGSKRMWGLLPVDELVWPDQRLRYAETPGVELDDLVFRDDEQRLECLRDVGL